MGFPFIREGDSTSHDGRVLACTSTNVVHGKPLALVGDMVSCPRCRGVYPIVNVKNLGMTFGGRAVASEGDKTACGATLIASQAVATASPTSGASVGGSKSIVAEQASPDGGSYRGRFRLIDDDTRAPVANHPYTVQSADGKTVSGKTDANGFTNWLDSERASSLTFNPTGSSDPEGMVNP